MIFRGLGERESPALPKRRTGSGQLDMGEPGSRESAGRSLQVTEIAGPRRIVMVGVDLRGCHTSLCRKPTSVS